MRVIPKSAIEQPKARNLVMTADPPFPIGSRFCPNVGIYVLAEEAKYGDLAPYLSISNNHLSYYEHN